MPPPSLSKRRPKRPRVFRRSAAASLLGIPHLRETLASLRQPARDAVRPSPPSTPGAGETYFDAPLAPAGEGPPSPGPRRSPPLSMPELGPPSPPPRRTAPPLHLAAAPLPQRPSRASRSPARSTSPPPAKVLAAQSPSSGEGRHALRLPVRGALSPPPFRGGLRQVAPTPAPRQSPEAMDTQPSYAAVASTPPATSPRLIPQRDVHSPLQAKPASQPAPPKRERYPPLVVEVLPDWARHFRALREKLGHPPNARPYGRGVRFIPRTGEEYRTIQSYLMALEKETTISWFSYSLPAERNLKVAIRGLPVDTDPALIEAELRRLGYTPEFVRAIQARFGRPGCIYHAQLERNAATIPGIYGVTELLNMPGVKIEAWRGKKGPAQCHRCQQFRHSSHKCHRKIACVRCGEEHAARDCPRPREQPATCANCGGPHPANHVACPAFVREARNKKAGTTARTSSGQATKKVLVAPTGESNAQGSLMAAANGPKSGPTKRRKRRRGREGKGPFLPQIPPRQQPKEPATSSAPKTTPSIRPPAPSQGKGKSAGTGDPAAAKKAALLVAMGVLQDVLKALEQDLDPVTVLLDGMKRLLTA
ncbi:uncharacterized protein LOC126381258 [Pectinophora gossypiella]|uniref:uncharacterized protein LOC126376842 n=1 Tax=Pectinophora gossypiella TaxID=13191 RepID=UPI00214E2C6F|nr:uncharacterized protein LOC126376842 [Pectinophora gossypiella]XP_049886710.1 uncharacterized protein LOC126381258 [Pectinophora gossypiella]